MIVTYDDYGNTIIKFENGEMGNISSIGGYIADEYLRSIGK